MSTMRIRIDSIDFTGSESAKIMLTIVGHALESAPISDFDIFACYETGATGEKPDAPRRVARIPGNIEDRKMTVIVSGNPMKLSDRMRLGVRAIYKPNIQGLIVWTERIARC